MAESGVILPADSTGKALRTQTATTTFTTGSGGVVHQQVVTNADSAGNFMATSKGTQNVSALSVQDMKDSGRATVVLSVTAVASTTAATLFTLNIWQAGAVTTGSSYTVPAGKTFRVQSIQFGARFATPSATVTFATAQFNLRAVASGGTMSATAASVYGDSKMAASNVATPNSDLDIPDGMEFPAGYILGLSHTDSAATLLLDALIVGFTY